MHPSCSQALPKSHVCSVRVSAEELLTSALSSNTSHLAHSHLWEYFGNGTYTNYICWLFFFPEGDKL